MTHKFAMLVLLPALFFVLPATAQMGGMGGMGNQGEQPRGESSLPRAPRAMFPAIRKGEPKICA